MKLTKVCLSIAVILWINPVFASDPLWTHSLDKKVAWSQVTSAGTLLVSTGKQISHINHETGDLLWSKETGKNLAPFNFHDLQGSGYLLIADQFQNIPPKTRLSMYELLNGELIWETDDLLASNLAVIPDLQRGQLIYIGAFPGSPKDKTNGTLLRAYDLATGSIKYQTEIGKYNKFPMHSTDTSGTFSAAFDLSGHPEPLVEGNIMYLPYSGMMALNLDDGSILWEQEFKTVDTGLKRTNASPQIEDDIIYAAGRGVLVAMNKKSGEILWNTKIGKKYALPEMQILDERIIVRIGGLFSNGKSIAPKKPFGIASIDKATGKKQWDWKKAKNSITNMQVLPGSNQVVVADKKNLYRLDLAASGKASVLEKRNLEFKRKMGGIDAAVKGGKVVSGLLSGGLVGGLQGGFSASKDDRSDPPSNISNVGGALVVQGNYHVLSYSLGENEDNWSVEFSPPGVSPMMLALSGAAMAFTAMGNAGYHTSMSTRDRKVDSSLKSANNLGAVMTKRYAAAATSGNLGFFLTKADNESGHSLQLTGLDLATGEEIGSVPIKEKEPSFRVDHIGRMVYYFENKKNIQAFGF